MAKSFIDVVQDSLRTGLGIPVERKKPPALFSSTRVKSSSRRTTQEL